MHYTAFKDCIVCNMKLSTKINIKIQSEKSSNNMGKPQRTNHIQNGRNIRKKQKVVHDTE